MIFKRAIFRNRVSDFKTAIVIKNQSGLNRDPILIAEQDRRLSGKIDPWLFFRALFSSFCHPAKLREQGRGFVLCFLFWAAGLDKPAYRRLLRIHSFPSPCRGDNPR